MAAPLSVCSKEEQRGVIFLLSEGVTGAEIHRRLSAEYRDRALPRRSVYEWIEKFQHGRTSVKDEESAGRPSTPTILKLVMVLHMTYNMLGFRKVCAGWFPKQLTEEQKNNRVANCQCLLDRYANEGEAFLTRILTGDETWVHNFAPESKHQSMEWKHPGSPVKK